MGHGLDLVKMKAICNIEKGAEKAPDDMSVGIGVPTGHIR